MKTGRMVFFKQSTCAAAAPPAQKPCGRCGGMMNGRRQRPVGEKKGLILLLMSCALAAAGFAERTKPNVVLIVSDDQSQASVAPGDKTFDMPHLDRLRSEGIWLSQCYSSAPVCSPTRAALLTGLCQQRVSRCFDWVVGGRHGTEGLPPGTVTLPEMLRRNGYATGMFGKWHLGGCKEKLPTQFGFDEFKGYRGGNLDYWTHTDNLGRHDLWDGTEPLHAEGYLTELVAEWTVDFIGRNKENPFFVYVPFPAPHWPYQGPVAPYKNIERESYEKAGGSFAIYKSMLESLDDGVDRILAALEKNGLERDTLIIFTSDNAAGPPSQTKPQYGNNPSFRGEKATLFEGGIRVPGMVRWRGRIPASETCDTPVVTMDFTETILAVTGTKRPENIDSDGMNLMPLLQGNAPAAKRDLFWYANNKSNNGNRPQRALRSGDWKFYQTDKETYLFNLKQDPAEQENLASQYPEATGRFRKTYADWESTLPEKQEKRKTHP